MNTPKAIQVLFENWKVWSLWIWDEYWRLNKKTSRNQVLLPKLGRVRIILGSLNNSQMIYRANIIVQKFSDTEQLLMSK